jgi:hypothetical protein
MNNLFNGLNASKFGREFVSYPTKMHLIMTDREIQNSRNMENIIAQLRKETTKVQDLSFKT